MPSTSIDKLNPKEFILIKGARVHNLKNIDVAIPRNKLVVITGLSGSGKSSLAFHTLYAEGQRRYVESLSSYARQFLGKVEKPDVDYIKGVSPAIAIEQKVNTTNSRSTVGTTTEIYDYIKLLYARIGKVISPKDGLEIKADKKEDVLDKIASFPEKSKVYILSTLKEVSIESLQNLTKQGFSRVLYQQKEEWIEDITTINKGDECHLIIDRFIVNSDTPESKNRILESIETAIFEGKGKCIVMHINVEGIKNNYAFNTKIEQEGFNYIEPSFNLFSFNNPIGACPTCEGFGKVIGIDSDLVIPNPALSVYQNAVVCWNGEKMQKWKEQLLFNAEKADFPIHKPILQLNEKQKHTLWEGCKHFDGINDFFSYVESKSYKIQYRVLLARYRGRTNCPECKGSRIRKEASYVKIDNTNISTLVNKPIDELQKFFNNIKLSTFDKEISKRLLQEIENRIAYMIDVGLGYLTLNRASSTLSGGESQRINLATSLGSSLVGSMYILDEPSIGLHPNDTKKLIRILRSLQKQGNTVIVVEHDEDIMLAADEVIDLGPEAGSNGGNLVFQGAPKQLLKADTLTAKYINKLKKTEREQAIEKHKNFVHLIEARENNLKGIDIKFPLNCLTVVSGVSGSGKSTLVKKILYPALQKKLGTTTQKAGLHREISGEIKLLNEVQFIDQNPIGKSSRSNPVTYIKAFDEIRNLFTSLGISKNRGYKTAHFSFNVEGGRCEVCQGEGMITESMQFMADIHLLCEECNGHRFKDEILEVKFSSKNISDILSMTIEDAIQFFSENEQNKIAAKVADKLKPLLEVGLGYVKLGQASSTLSGGEAQRIKLASFLGKGNTKNKILFIFDEPTTGLHFHDINKLLKSFDALIEKGHSILVIEHNIEVIEQADWIIDLGLYGGDKGGDLIFQGRLADLKSCKASITAKYLT